MKFRRVASVVVCLAVCLVSIPALAAPTDSTGAPPMDAIESRPPMTKAQDLLQVSVKLTHENKLIADRLRQNSTMAGGITPQGCVPGDICNPPASYDLVTTNVNQMPVSSDNRACVHCGVAATTISLRYFASRSRLTLNDIPADNPTAIKRLGDGWLNNQSNAAYAIMQYTSSAGWYADQWQMRDNINARESYAGYIISNRNSYASATALSSPLKTTIWAEKPAIFLVDTSFFTYYRGRSLGHFVAMDAYSSSGANHRLNDPNNCALVPDANGARTVNVAGYHWVSQTETYNALYPTYSLIW